VEIEKERRKASMQTRRSEGLIWACLHTLLHLAENLDVERKMCKRGIVQLILPLLVKGRENCRLQLLAINFLRKLSIFEENKNAMVALGAGPLLVDLLPSPEDSSGRKAGGGSKKGGGGGSTATAGGAESTATTAPPSPLLLELRASVLHLMFNLTFDPTMCASFLHCGTVPKAASMLRLTPFRLPGLKLLYRLSTDYAVRGQFATVDAVSLTLTMVLKFPSPRLPAELAALAANLTMHPLTAEAILQVPDSVKKLTARLVKTGDAACAKLLRGLSQYTYALAADAELRAAAGEEVAAMDPRLACALGLARLGKPGASKGTKGRAAAAQAAVARAVRAKAEAGGEGKVGDAAEEEALLESAPGAAAQSRQGTTNFSRKQGGGQATTTTTTSMGEPLEPPALLPDDHLDSQRQQQQQPLHVVDGFSPMVGSWSPPPPHPVTFSTPHDGVWTPVIPDILSLLAQSEAQDIVDVSVELLGLLANMLPRDVPGGRGWSTLLGSSTRGEGSLMHTLSQRLLPREDTQAEDDLLLESIMLLGSLALDPESAGPLAASPLPRTLIFAIRARGRMDSDICLQGMVTLNRLLCHDETREVLLSDPSLVSIIAVLLAHPHPGISAEAEDAAYVVGEHDKTFGGGELWEALRARRFEVHNEAWCKSVAKAAGAVVKAHPGGLEGGTGKSLHEQQLVSAAHHQGNPAAPNPERALLEKLRATLVGEARQTGAKGPHYWLPGGTRYAVVCVDAGEEAEACGGGEEDVPDSLEDDMLAARGRVVKGGGVLSPDRASAAGVGGSPLRGETSVPFDMDFLWQQANSVGNSFGEKSHLTAGGRTAAATLSPRLHGHGAGGLDHHSGGFSNNLGGVPLPGGNGPLENNPLDYGEEVEEVGEHEESGDNLNGWASDADGGGTDAEDEMRAAAFLNPYGGR